MNLKYIHALLFTFFILITSNSFSQQKTFYWTDTIHEDGMKCISKRSIFFKLGKAELLDTSFIYLDSIVHFMDVNKKVGLVINVHGDARNSEIRSDRLTYNRAMSIENYLIKKGINADRLRAKGWESRKPLVSAAQIQKVKSKEEREILHALNRRTEFEAFIMKDSFLLHGEIVDRKENGDKIPFAEVKIYKTDSFITKAISDVDGNFTCILTKYGTYSFIVKYLGCVTDTAVFFIDYNNANYTHLIGMDCNHIICKEMPEDNYLLLYENLNADLAKHDIEKSIPKIFVTCGLTYTEETGQKAFEKMFGIKYVVYSCMSPPEDRMKAYNQVVFSYLDTKYGKSWRKKIRKNVVGLK